MPLLHDLNKSKAIFTRDQFASISLEILQAMPVEPRPLRSVRNQLEHPTAMINALILLHEMFSFKYVM